MNTLKVGNRAKPAMLSVISMLMLLTVGCSEKGVLLTAPSGPLPVDSVYTANIESVQPKNILIEEFTGVSCPPCPSGHAIVKSLRAQYPDRIIVIANHIFNFPQAAPVKDLSRQDFRTEDATEIGKMFGGIGFMPAGVVDRIKVANEYVLTSTSWANAVTSQIQKTALINLYVSSSFDAAKNKALVTVKLAYANPVSEKHALTLALIENNIIDAQKNQQVIDSFYEHNYVLRDVITGIGGSLILDSMQTKQAGLVVQRVFEVPILSAWKTENCKIVAFVHSKEAEEMDVYQTAETQVKK